MIVDYFRPKTLTEAIALLQRETPVTLPLGGGNIMSKYQEEPIAVVDLQALGLNQIGRENNKIEIGATATLAQIEAFLTDSVFKNVIQIQAGKNQRNSGTVAGLINVADGRSALLTLLLAVDAQLIWQPGEKMISLGNWLPQRKIWHEASLITKIVLPDVTVRFESVARTPKDRPIVAVAMAQWPSSRLRIAVGGSGPFPVLALDGTQQDDVEQAVDQAFYTAEDEWASASYRREAGRRLAVRLASELRLNRREQVK